MKKLRELLRLKFDSKLTHRQIGRALNISPGSVSYYAQAALALGLTWPLEPDLDDAQLMQQLEPHAKQLRQHTKAERAMPIWSDVKSALLNKHMTLALLRTMPNFIKSKPIATHNLPDCIKPGPNNTKSAFEWNTKPEIRPLLIMRVPPFLFIADRQRQYCLMRNYLLWCWEPRNILFVMPVKANHCQTGLMYMSALLSFLAVRQEYWFLIILNRPLPTVVSLNP